jgi:hypothetical protein
VPGTNNSSVPGTNKSNKSTNWCLAPTSQISQRIGAWHQQGE